MFMVVRASATNWAYSKRKGIVFVVLCCLVLLPLAGARSDTIVNDVSRLNPVTVSKVFKITSLDDIFEAVEYAKSRQLQVSIAGKKHSQGGQTAVVGGVVLDMSEFNKISWLSSEDKVITVQSGVTWAQIQKYINPQKLSVSVMQSSNIFTVGGSLSVNAHGRDPRWGPMIESILSFHIVLSDGREVEASRTSNSQLFRAVIGGYGVFGVITEITLRLSDNHLLNKIVTRVAYDDYIAHLKSILSSKHSLHYGRCSIVVDDSFFRDCVAIDFLETQRELNDDELVLEKNIDRDQYFFNLSRKYRWGKSLRWWLQTKIVDVPGDDTIITRNNAMRPPLAFLNYQSDMDTDILQEYFVPLDSFKPFMDELRQILLQNRVNVLSMTLRYLKQNDESYLSYASQEAIAIVLYMNVGVDHAAQELAAEWTRHIIDTALNYKGSYYLTYQSYPSPEQFRRAYPNWRKFERAKERYDPTHMFMNEFYKKYFSHSSLMPAKTR